MEFDKDLKSRQEVRDLLKKAHKAQEIFRKFNQEQIDKVVCALAQTGEKYSAHLAKLAIEETGIGVYEHKVLKNLFVSVDLFRYIKDLKTAGILREDRENKLLEIAMPMGIVAGIIPTTNPTSTAIFKILISVKSGNGIVLSPHPRAVKCTLETTRLLAGAAVDAGGAPEGLIGCMAECTMQGTEELMKHSLTSVILATGGAGLVRAAYSSGKPAFGVGPGNVPAFIERSADIEKAVKDIIASTTFDNGTICASEQAIVTEECIAGEVVRYVLANGGYFLSDAEREKVDRILVKVKGEINPEIVGKSAHFIAQKAGVSVPEETSVLLARLREVGAAHPFSMEKLSPTLGFYVEPDWERACERCIEILEFGGMGHTMAIHSRNEEIIREFGFKKPAYRIVVNTPSTFGGIGATTGLAPSLTLGCGTMGGNITGDNITPLHLINIKRVAYGIREFSSDIYNKRTKGETAIIQGQKAEKEIAASTQKQIHSLSDSEIQRIMDDFLNTRKKTIIS
jgi:acetaldehyde dehydrogenase (acetylating)